MGRWSLAARRAEIRQGDSDVANLTCRTVASILQPDVRPAESAEFTTRKNRSSGLPRRSSPQSHPKALGHLPACSSPPGLYPLPRCRKALAAGP